MTQTQHETVQLREVAKMAVRNGWQFVSEPETRYCAQLRTLRGVFHLIGADVGVNTAGSSRTCNDKAFTQFFLAKAGITTIPTVLLHTVEDLRQVHAFPSVIKPNSGLGGNGVSVAESRAT